MPAKYLNSPETELFKKRLNLYNGQTAKEAARGGQRVIVVEGYLDVIASVMAGFEGTVAPMGTALTEEHLQLLWRMSDEPILCFDGDAAGQRAAARATDIVLPQLQPGRTGEDRDAAGRAGPGRPDQGGGAGAFADVIDRARSLSDVIWSIETEGGMVPETPEARAALEARLKARANAIGEASVKRHYMQAFDEKLQAFFAPVRAPRWDERQGRRDNNRQGGRPRNGASGPYGASGQPWRSARGGVGYAQELAAVEAGTGASTRRRARRRS